MYVLKLITHFLSNKSRFWVPWRLRRKAVAKLCEWPTSRSVSDSSRYIRSNDQYAARRLVVVKDELPKGAEGLTDHSHASPSHVTVPLARLGMDEVGGWLFLAPWSIPVQPRRPVAQLQFMPRQVGCRDPCAPLPLLGELQHAQQPTPAHNQSNQPTPLLPYTTNRPFGEGPPNGLLYETTASTRPPPCAVFARACTKQRPAKPSVGEPGCRST